MTDEMSDYERHVESGASYLTSTHTKTFIPRLQETDHPQPFKTPWENLNQLEQPSFTIEGILPKGQVTWLYGDTGIGKSLIATDMALAVCYGTNAFARFETQRTGIFWLDYENGPEEHISRLKSFGHDPLDLEASNQFHIGSLPPSINPNNSQQLHQEITDLNVGLLIIDSSGVGIEGDSNSADTYADFAKHLLNPLKKDGVTVLVLDNIGKDRTKKAIGSARKLHESGAAWELTQKGDTWTLTCTKRRTLGLQQAIAIKQLTAPLKYVLTTYQQTLTGAQQLIIQYLDQWNGARMFTNDVLHQRLKDVGLSLKTTTMNEAINWWNKGDHQPVDN